MGYFIAVSVREVEEVVGGVIVLAHAPASHCMSSALLTKKKAMGIHMTLALLRYRLCTSCLSIKYFLNPPYIKWKLKYWLCGDRE